MVKNGPLFEAYTSLNGIDFTLRNSIVNAELNTPGEILQVGPSNMSFSSGGGATQSIVEIDFFELTLDEVPMRPPGDYNKNGKVDGADYVVWRNTLGQSGFALAADGNHNNQVDAGDFDIWRAHFGQTPSEGWSAGSGAAGYPLSASAEFDPAPGETGFRVPAAAVPEPASALFLSVAAVLLGAIPRRTFSRPQFSTGQITS
jgi:hypothetical protein